MPKHVMMSFVLSGAVLNTILLILVLIETCIYHIPHIAKTPYINFPQYVTYMRSMEARLLLYGPIRLNCVQRINELVNCNWKRMLELMSKRSSFKLNFVR